MSKATGMPKLPHAERVDCTEEADLLGQPEENRPSSGWPQRCVRRTESNVRPQQTD